MMSKKKTIFMVILGKKRIKFSKISFQTLLVEIFKNILEIK